MGGADDAGACPVNEAAGADERRQAHRLGRAAPAVTSLSRAAASHRPFGETIPPPLAPPGRRAALVVCVAEREIWREREGGNR